MNILLLLQLLAFPLLRLILEITIGVRAAFLKQRACNYLKDIRGVKPFLFEGRHPRDFGAGVIARGSSLIERCTSSYCNFTKFIYEDHNRI